MPEGKVQAFVELARQLLPTRYSSIDSDDYTSIIDRRAYERLRHAIDEARERGATVIALLPGRAFDDERHRIAPHIVVGAPEDCALMRREVFGPILPLLPYRQLDEVIARINAGPRPLALYPFSDDGATLDP